MRLTLIRHGQSVGNVQGIYQGQMDFPLTSQGKMEAKRLGCWLADEKIDCIYSSDLERAWQTAEEIARYHHLQIHSTTRLREMCLGRFEGLKRSEIVEKYPELVNIDWFSSHLEDVEQMEELRMRGLALLNEWLKKHVGEKIVAVSHGGFINALLMALFKIEWQGMRVFAIQNTSMTTIKFSSLGQYVVLGVNETPHLAREKKEKEMENKEETSQIL